MEISARSVPIKNIVAEQIESQCHEPCLSDSAKLLDRILILSEVGTGLEVNILSTRGYQMINGVTCGNVTMRCANELSDLIRTSFQTILNQVADSSPSDSLVKAHLEMRDGLYDANIEIHSSELNICAQRSGDSVVSLLGSLKHDLMEQIDAWKKVRTVAM